MTHFTRNAATALFAVLLMAGSFSAVTAVPPSSVFAASAAPVLA
jgi:hypothetical protein